MKVGSLVVCVDNSKCITRIKPSLEPTVYTVRKIIPEGSVIGIGPVKATMFSTGIYLEEIVNELQTHMGVIFEPPYAIEWFREVQPPMSISIEELMKEPELV